MEQFEHALRVNPRCVQALIGKALAFHVGLKGYDHAIDAYHQALSVAYGTSNSEKSYVLAFVQEMLSLALKEKIQNDVVQTSY